MPEYIERETAIEIIDNYGKTISKDCIAVYQAIRDIVDVICPVADVVEVVRCSECKHFCPYEGEEHKGDCAELVGLESCVYEDDFCSYGEKAVRK